MPRFFKPLSTRQTSLSLHSTDGKKASATPKLQTSLVKDMEDRWPASWPIRADEFHTFDPNGDVLLIVSRRPTLEDEEEYDSDVSSIASSDTPEVEEVPPDVTLPEHPSGEPKDPQPLQDDSRSSVRAKG